MNGDQSICLAIVEAIAECKGVKPEELRPPLHNAVDTDALDSLFRTRPDDEHIAVEFTYDGYTIHVEGPDEITVEKPTSKFKVQGEVA